MSSNVVEYQKGNDRGLLIRMVDERGRPVTGFSAPSAGAFALRASEDGADLIVKTLVDLTVNTAAGTIIVALAADDTSSLEPGTYLAEASLTVDGNKYASRIFFVKLIGSITL